MRIYDFTEIHTCTDEKIKFEEGLTYHIWRPGNVNYGFASEVWVIEILERPSAPEAEIDYIDTDYVKLKEIDDSEYRIADGELVADGEISVNLEMIDYDDNGIEIPVNAKDYK